MTDVATLPHTEGRPPLELPIHRRTVEEDVAVQTPPNSLEQLAAEASLENLSLDDQMARLNISLEDEPEMLKVVLRPVLGCKIGMTVMRFAEGFIVTSIHDKGIVASWNAAHPGQSLEERDLIVQINGSGEYLQMLHHFRCAPVLLMLIHRQEPLKSRQLPQGAQFEPRSGKESKDNFVLESNLALRSITECAGTHPDEVWKAAALCVVEHFVQQDPFFLSLYGYKALTSKMWSPLNEGLKPRLSLKVSQHIEQAGHTWYIVECELLALSGEQEMALRWESPRRLSQLRGELHDRIKFTMDSAEYRSLSKGGYSQVPPSIDTSQLAPIMRRHYRPAANWTQVIEQLREKLPGQLHSMLYQLGRRELLTPPVIRPPEPVMMRAETRPPGPWEKVSQSTSNNPERALQWSTDGRPKLVLKPRNPALAAPIATAPSSTQQPQPKHTMKSPEIPLRPQSQLQPQVQLQSPPQAQPQPQTQVQHPARPQVPQVQQVQQASAPQADAPKPAWSQIVQGLAAAPVQQVLVSQSRQRANTAPSPTNLAPAVPMQCKQQVPVQSVGSQQRACSPPVTQTLVVGAVQQAVQNGVVSPSGRPKLQLKPRDPRLGPPGQAASANAPVEQSQPAEPPPAQPAMQPDPAGGRPRLVLKKRTEPPPAVASVNPAAVRVSSPPARPAPAQTASPGMRPAPAPAVPPPMPSQDATHGSCAKAPAALQKDPAGGRPRLVLKPRTSVK